MRKLFLILSFVFAISSILFPRQSSALLIHVDAAATGANNGFSQADAFTSIQAGIDAAQNRDTVIVYPGTYIENINFHGKAITVTSAISLDRSVVASTIIDGNQNGSVVTFNSGETINSILSGFTIRNGNGTLIDGLRYGGGVYCGSGSNPTIRHNKIINNSADVGGAIYVLGNSIVADPASVNLITGESKTLTFYIPEPAPVGGKNLVLSSSVPIVASVPATAFIPQGQKSVSAVVTALSYGATTITANSAPYSKGQVPVTVTNPPLITFTPAPLNVAAGLVEKCTVNISNPAPAGGLVVDLTGSNGKIDMPSSIVIPEASTSITFSAKGLAAGTTTLTASASGFPNANLQVNVSTGVFNLFPSYIPIAVGRSSTLQLSIPNFAPAGGLTVNLTSNNTALVTVPATASIPEGQKTVLVPVNGVGVGSAQVTATLTGFQSAQATVNVLQVYNISFSPPSLIITPGTSVTADVVISSPAPEGGLTITLTNPSQDKISLPSSVFIPEGQFKNAISISGLDTTETPVTIIASCPALSDGQLSATVQAKYQPWIRADVVVGAGTKTTGAVGLTGATAPTGGYTVNLTSSNPAVASVPATVTIPAGSVMVTFVITGNAAGTATITAEAQGLIAENETTVVTPTFEWYSLPTQMTLGATQSYQLRTYVPNGSYYRSYYNNPDKQGATRQVVAQAVTVSLSSENPAVIQVPATATIVADSYQTNAFSIQAAGTGTSTLTASAAGWDSKTSGVITVVP